MVSELLQADPLMPYCTLVHKHCRLPPKLHFIFFLNMYKTCFTFRGQHKLFLEALQGWTLDLKVSPLASLWLYWWWSQAQMTVKHRCHCKISHFLEVPMTFQEMVVRYFLIQTVWLVINVKRKGSHHAELCSPLISFSILLLTS